MSPQSLHLQMFLPSMNLAYTCNGHGDCTKTVPVDIGWLPYVIQTGLKFVSGDCCCPDCSCQRLSAHESVSLGHCGSVEWWRLCHYSWRSCWWWSTKWRCCLSEVYNMPTSFLRSQNLFKRDSQHQPPPPPPHLEDRSCGYAEVPVDLDKYL